MNYANIKWCDIANGSGVRISLFVSGCTRHCKGCFNQIAWDFNYGQPFTPEVARKIETEAQKEYISGITILGGEPLEPQNIDAVSYFILDFKKNCPDKTIWLYTWRPIEDLVERAGHSETVRRILEYVDVIVDGEFMEDKKDPSLAFRGSSNQRIINVKEYMRKLK